MLVARSIVVSMGWAGKLAQRRWTGKRRRIMFRNIRIFRKHRIMRVSSAEFLKRYGALSDKALSEPVTITRNGRDRLVLMSAEAFEKLTRYAPRARHVTELTDEELTLISEARVSAEHDPLNALLDD